MRSVLARLRRMRTGLLAAALALVALGAFWLWAASGMQDAFVFMGFDQDRAVLLTAAVGAGLAGAIAGLAGARRALSALTGLVGLGALFGSTYVTETLRATGHVDVGVGQFTPLGWLITTVGLAATGALLGLGTGILGEQARRGAMALGGETLAALRGRGTTPAAVRRLPLRRIGVTATILLALVIALPVAGQLVNYGPDSLMLSGAPAGVPLVNDGGSPGFSTPIGAGPTTSPTPGASTSAGASSVAFRVGSGLYPWRASRTSGSGTVVLGTLPAPWTGGTSSVASFWVYLPPGYAGSSRRYPVVYEIPWAITLYDNGANVRPMLDALMNSGAIPASIVVFLTSNGGPYVDNECIDSAGGVERFDTFVGTTLVHYVDATYRTIPRPAARTLLGDSQGGFCAANVLLHHPGVFQQEISFSGYYSAAPLLHMTPSAQAPYGGEAALELANSPILIADRLPPSLRSLLMFTLVGNPQQAFYGPQLVQFASVARALGYHVTVLDSAYGHSWLAVRAELPVALQVVGLRQAAEGVFASG